MLHQTPEANSEGRFDCFRGMPSYLRRAGDNSAYAGVFNPESLHPGLGAAVPDGHIEPGFTPSF